MTIPQISVFLENRMGQLAEITGILSDNGVDLRAIHIAEMPDYGVVRMITDDARKAARVLSEHDFVLSVTEVAVVAVPDEVGGLHRVTEVLAEAGIDVEYMYSLFAQKAGTAFMAFRVAEPDELDAVLAAHGLKSADKKTLGIL